jgi:ubiquinone/menaquinone biosynthesis C-methylase UbiE
MSDKNYYETYWMQQIKGEYMSEPPEWTPENIKWHMDFFKGHIKGKTVDIGGGDGTLLNSFWQEFNLKNPISLDNSENASRLGHRKYPSIKFITSSIENLSVILTRNSIDTVVAVEVLEHILDIDKCLEEIRCVLRKGGHLCVTTTDFNLAKKLLIAGFEWDKYFFPSNPHIRFFTGNSLKSIMYKHGFERIAYRWNRSYVHLMPKGQMAVFKKI